MHSNRPRCCAQIAQCRPQGHFQVADCRRLAQRPALRPQISTTGQFKDTKEWNYGWTLTNHMDGKMVDLSTSPRTTLWSPLPVQDVCSPTFTTCNWTSCLYGLICMKWATPGVLQSLRSSTHFMVSFVYHFQNDSGVGPGQHWWSYSCWFGSAMVSVFIAQSIEWTQCQMLWSHCYTSQHACKAATWLCAFGMGSWHCDTGWSLQSTSRPDITKSLPQTHNWPKKALHHRGDVGASGTKTSSRSSTSSTPSHAGQRSTRESLCLLETPGDRRPWRDLCYILTMCISQAWSSISAFQLCSQTSAAQSTRTSPSRCSFGSASGVPCQWYPSSSQAIDWTHEHETSQRDAASDGQRWGWTSMSNSTGLDWSLGQFLWSHGRGDQNGWEAVEKPLEAESPGVHSCWTLSPARRYPNAGWSGASFPTSSTRQGYWCWWHPTRVMSLPTCDHGETHIYADVETPCARPRSTTPQRRSSRVSVET